MNMRNVQQAVRAHQRARDLPVGSRVTFEVLKEDGYFEESLSCPDGNPYVCDETVPESGNLFLRCSDSEHMNFDHHDW